MKTAIEIAAQVWCDPRCANKIMDPELCKIFAEKIDALLRCAAIGQHFINVGSENYREIENLQNEMTTALAALEAADAGEGK